MRWRRSTKLIKLSSMPAPVMPNAQAQPVFEARPMEDRKLTNFGFSAMNPQMSGATVAPMLMPMYSKVNAPSRRGSSLAYRRPTLAEMLGFARHVPTEMKTNPQTTPVMLWICRRSWPMAMKLPPRRIVRLAPKKRSAIWPPESAKR